MAVTSTLSPSPSVSPGVLPTATPVAVSSTVQPSDNVNLIGQIQHVDPLIWTALAGILIVPFVHQGIKKGVKFLNEPQHRVTNYVLATLLSVVVGLLTDLQNSGVLTQLHNPALATLLASALSYLLGQQVYGFFIKTNQEAKANSVPSELPTVLNP